MAVRMFVAYDVVADSRRAKLAARLQAWGDRIQKSVFFIEVRDECVDDLMIEVESCIDPNQDHVVYIRQCAACEGKMVMLGQAALPVADIGWFVV